MTNKCSANFREGPCNGTAMRKASRRVSQLYDAALEPCGLKGTQYAILSELDRKSTEPPTMAELAQALVVDRTALSHNLKPLERDGFLSLQESEEDRRRRHIVMTPKGRKKFKEARRFWQSAQSRFAAVVGEREAQRLRSTLLRIAYNDRLGSLND